MNERVDDLTVKQMEKIIKRKRQSGKTWSGNIDGLEFEAFKKACFLLTSIVSSYVVNGIYQEFDGPKNHSEYAVTIFWI